MNNITISFYNLLQNKIYQICLCLFLGLTGITTAFAEAYTGKTVIDGVVYGESNNQAITGSGVMGKVERQVQSFTKIKTLGAMEVHYRRGTDISVEITGDQNLLALITTQVNQGVLIIDAQQSYQPKLPLIVEIRSPHLTEITQEGSGDIKLTDINENAFDINIMGSSTVTAEGKAAQFKARLEGSGDLNAKALISTQAGLEISGSGSINLTVKERLDAKISGSGEINYFGHPAKITQEITGSGVIQAGE